MGIAAYRRPPRFCPLCGLPAKAKSGLCHTHNERWRRWGKPPVAQWIEAFLGESLTTCIICGRRFNGFGPTQTACATPECDRERRRRAGIANYHARSHERKKADSERAQSLARARREQRKINIACKICGAEFVGYPYRTMCANDACRKENLRRICDEKRRAEYVARLGGQMRLAEKLLEENKHGQ